MPTRLVRCWGVGVGLAGGTAVTVALLGMGAARADDGTDAINGWTVTATGGTDSGVLTTPATLSDPSDSLGLGTEPIVGGWASVPATPLSSVGSNDQFVTPFSTLTQPDNLYINNAWFPGLDLASVQRGFGDNFSATGAVLALSHNGKDVVDLFQFSSPDQPIPLFNPDATGPVDIGGVELASPDAGALLNDLFDAVFTGDATAWTNATTLLGDLFGIDPSGAADAVDTGGWLTDLGF